jgi:proline iminopeptidase
LSGDHHGVQQAERFLARPFHSRSGPAAASLCTADTKEIKDMAEPLYPPIDPYDRGMLEVGDGNRVYWEVCGNPDGKPALFVHGGPGWGCQPDRRRHFDPDRYRFVLFDQRGCGRSTPHASDLATDMRHNTTEHLLADMEQLREYLGIRCWLLCGGSWGSTLLLAYAQRHPHRVSEIVIAGVTTSRRSEIDWLYQGAGRFFPEQWERFRAGVPAPGHGGDLLGAYARLLEDPDPDVRAQAADSWCAWEDALLSHESGGTANAFASRAPADKLALVRICAHYFAQQAWLEDGALLRDAGCLAGIPGVLIHGRLDLSSPLDTAWELARAWSDAELVVIDDAGHTGSDAMRARIRSALDGFARP